MSCVRPIPDSTDVHLTAVPAAPRATPGDRTGGSVGGATDGAARGPRLTHLPPTYCVKADETHRVGASLSGTPREPGNLTSPSRPDGSGFQDSRISGFHPSPPAASPDASRPPLFH